MILFLSLTDLREFIYHEDTKITKKEKILVKWSAYHLNAFFRKLRVL